ncbi:MAG: hypothetical protein HY017_20055 [Betaproteobacteria bacterium]|nr:hypothetical protein [Betaproteobacteria bacterium]
MKTRWILLATILALAAGATHAQSVKVVGSGSLKCSDWMLEARDQGVGYFRTQDWMLGYLRGVSDASTTPLQVDPFATIDVVAMNAWLEAYCRANPLESIYRATGVLATEMLRGARKQ